MKQQTEKKLQVNLKAINNDFNTVIFADIEVKFKLMELEAIRILIESSTGTSSSKKSNTYDSYDDGYDDIYMDGDYDYDRYDSDNDYADGVDDAMDEFDEDW